MKEEVQQQQKKKFYPLSGMLREYLKHYKRQLDLPVHYENLLQSVDVYPVMNAKNEDTLWQTMIYDQNYGREIFEGLKKIYVLLRSGGDERILPNLYVDRVDYCTFGNTKPFRIRIVNQYNDNHDYFYVKRADASRVYGLELEQLLSPNEINFQVDQDTLIEEHIIGVPGDDFIRNYLNREELNEVRLAKEFIKFNERCFARLLGDMRAYNYVVEMTPDLEYTQYRVRAIDFDQQSYEGRRSFYLPQFFKNNLPVVNLCTRLINRDTSLQYQREERTLIQRRFNFSQTRIKRLRTSMCEDRISSDEKVRRLREELARMHGDQRFESCRTMGEITFLNISKVLDLADEAPSRFVQGLADY
jgi:hypothetical protein